VETTLDNQQGNLERQLVEKFLVLDADAKRLSAIAEEKKRERDTIEAELLELLNDEGKKASARYEGVGHVTVLDPVVSSAYVLDGQDEILFSYLRDIEREDLIKTIVNHSSLAALLTQHIKEGKEIPSCLGYVMKQKLRAYPEKR